MHSVAASSIFEKLDRVGKDQYTKFIKYDLIMKQNIFEGIETERLGSAKNDAEGFQMAQQNFAKILLVYMQQLHESSDARVLGLYTDQYDFL